MDIWKYITIGHDNHLFCNPLSAAKVDELVELLRIPKGGRLVDIACGKGEFLRRAVRRWSCRGVGVELDEGWVSVARAKAAEWSLEGQIEVVQSDGAKYEDSPGSFDAAVCLGASWIWGVYAGTLEALVRWTRPGGTVLVGEPFWIREPSSEHLAAAKMQRSQFGSHVENVEVGEGTGLSFLHAIVSSHDDWDRYQGYQWDAAARYAQRNPGDPDIPELMRRMRGYRDIYLKWGRAELGWATYLFLKP